MSRHSAEDNLTQIVDNKSKRNQTQGIKIGEISYRTSSKLKVLSIEMGFIKERRGDFQLQGSHKMRNGRLLSKISAALLLTRIFRFITLSDRSILMGQYL